MTDRSRDSLEERVARLERTVDRLQRTLKQLIDRLAERESVRRHTASARPGGRDQPRGSAAAGVRTAARDARSDRPDGTRATRPSWFAEREPQFWLSRIGIALVLFGVVFLFKYAVDRGWLSESIRVALGALLGVGLFVIGVRLYRERAWFGRVLMGGGIAALYITGFAAFQWYELASHTVAFGFMVMVTVLAYYAALWQEEAVMSVIGTMGALATPFLLSRGEGSVAALSLYTALVIAGAGLVFLFKGWRALLLVNVLGGWLVVVATVVVAAERQVTSVDLVAVQFVVLVALIVFWVVSVVRVGQLAPREAMPPYAHVLSVVAPLATLWLSVAVWDLSSASAGWFAVLGAGLLTAAAFLVYRWPEAKPLAYAQAVSAAVLLTVAAGLLLSGEPLLLAWTIEALALHAIATRTSNRLSTIGAHVLTAVAVLWLAARLVEGRVIGPPILNTAGLTDLVVIGMIFIAAMYIPKDDEGNVYRLLAHIAFLGWLWRELSALPNGNGFVTIAWGIYAIGLVVLSLVRRMPLLQRVALVTLLLVVGKLFLVDLARVEAIWRIMLFLGFGGLFLVLSYYFRDLWTVTSSAQSDESLAAEEP